MIVVDSSVIAEALGGDGAPGARARTRLHDQNMVAPYLLDLEVLSAWRKWAAAGELDDDRAAGARAALADLPIQRVAHTALVERCWELRGNVTPYDAAYVALAELLDAPLITLDARLARAPGPRCEIELLS